MDVFLTKVKSGKKGTKEEKNTEKYFEQKVTKEAKKRKKSELNIDEGDHIMCTRQTKNNIAGLTVLFLSVLSVPSGIANGQYYVSQQGHLLDANPRIG